MTRQKPTPQAGGRRDGTKYNQVAELSDMRIGQETFVGGLLERSGLTNIPKMGASTAFHGSGRRLLYAADQPPRKPSDAGHPCSSGCRHRDHSGVCRRDSLWDSGRNQNRGREPMGCRSRHCGHTSTRGPATAPVVDHEVAIKLAVGSFANRDRSAAPLLISRPTGNSC